MPICILLRHGRTQANAQGTLAGWTAGVGLDDTGRQQAARVGSRLSETGIAGIVSSPLQRCQETAEEVVAKLAQSGADRGVPDGFLGTDERLAEVRYGAWTGRSLKELAKEPLWRMIQDQPSQVTFPADPQQEHEHESMSAMQQRAVSAIADWDAHFAAEGGPGAIWVAVSHGDVIKAILADALAMELDDFQRIVTDPASLSIIHRAEYDGAVRPFVMRMNDTGSDPVDLSGVVRALSEREGPVDAAVGGGAGVT